MKTGVRVGIALLLVTLAWSAYAQSSSSSSEPQAVKRQDRLISQIYVEQAANALAKKNWNAVESLVKVALEFDHRSSDALYLRAEALQSQGGEIPKAISSYRAALASDTFKRFTATSCTMKLVPLLLRTKHYREALHDLRGLGNLDAAVLYYNAEGLVGLGRDFQARNLLAQAQAAYPGDARFSLLRVRIDPQYRQTVALRYLGATSSTAIDRRVLVGIVSHTRNPSVKRRLVALYNKYFPPSTTVFAQSLLASSTVTPAQIDRYVSDGLLANGRLTQRLYAHLSPGAARNRLIAKEAAYTGQVGLDTNGDGFNEETAHYSAGTLQSLTVDPNQNGVPEYDVGFSGGVPNTVAFSSGGVTYHLTYGSYPFVAQASVDEKGSRASYTLLPGRVSFPLFGARTSIPSGPAAFPPLVKTSATIGRHELFSFATEIKTTNSVSQLPVSLWKKSIDNIIELEKGWQGGRYTYRAFYHGGQKYSAEIDLDNDGYYEVHEYYRNGKVWKITYDGDKDGIPEFTLVLKPYPILSWDFNDDGVPDEIEKKISPTTTILEFSTKMNGVYNVTTKEVKK